jgi:hypothetical protein
MLQIRYDNKLRYRNNYAFVTISAAILVETFLSHKESVGNSLENSFEKSHTIFFGRKSRDSGCKLAGPGMKSSGTASLSMSGQKSFGPATLFKYYFSSFTT